MQPTSLTSLHLEQWRRVLKKLGAVTCSFPTDSCNFLTAKSPLALKLRDKSVEFRTTLDFDREYLRNRTRHQQSENGVASRRHYARLWCNLTLTKVIDRSFRIRAVSAAYRWKLSPNCSDKKIKFCDTQKSPPPATTLLAWRSHTK